MHSAVARIASPTPLFAALFVAAVGYFVLWGCFNTAAPTLRPVAPFAEGHDTQVGVGLTGTASLVNFGTGTTAYVTRRVTPFLDVSGYGQTGLVLPGPLAVPSGLPGQPGALFGGAVGGGGAARLRWEVTDFFTIGLEGQLGFDTTILSGGGGTGFGLGNLTQVKTYAGVPIAVGLGELVTFYSNPSVGGVVLLTKGGSAGDQVIPAPISRLPLGLMLHLAPRFSLLVETGTDGIPFVTSGPYLTVGGAGDF